MTQYELMYIIPAKLEEAQKQAVIDKINQNIQTAGGTIRDHQTWLTRKLSYPIKHIRQGIFMLAHLSLPEKELNKFKKDLDLDEEILRHLITKVDLSQEKLKSRARPELVLPQSVKAGKPANTPVPDKAEDKVSLAELDKKLAELLSEESTVK